MKWFKEYISSLKNVHAEEFLDILLFRPIAFVIVKSLYSLPITPNQYSLMALLSGCLASFYFYHMQFAYGAIAFFMFAVLDCCDGMQARMKKNGSEFGRFVDGLVDYVTNIIVYTTLAIGIGKAMPEVFGVSSVWLMVFAGLSKALHSITYDHYLMEYLSYANGEEGFTEKELIMIKSKLEEAQKAPKKDYLRILILKIYLGFTTLQSKDSKKNVKVKTKYNAKEYAHKNLLTLKMWSLIGPAPHILVLVVAFLFMRPEILFAYAIGFGNLWMLLMFIIQKKVNDDTELVRIA